MLPATNIPATDRLDRFARLMEVAATFYRAHAENVPKPMDISREDVQHLFRSLHKQGVQYLLVGGMAGVVHGHIRTTQDLNLWIRVGDDNKARLVQALVENDVAGAELLTNGPLLLGLSRPGWTTVQVGKSGFTLGMGHALKAFSDGDFDVCYARALDGVPFKVIHLTDLIIEKKATGRAKDLGDVDELIRINQRNADDTDTTAPLGPPSGTPERSGAGPTVDRN